MMLNYRQLGPLKNHREFLHRKKNKDKRKTFSLALETWAAQEKKRKENEVKHLDDEN